MIQRSHRAEIRGGFTLMEMLVVVAIIVLLAAMAVPIVMGRLDEAKRGRAKADSRTIGNACEMYQMHYGNLPASLNDLTVTGADGTKPYLGAESLYDPWRNPYQYAANGPHNAATGKPDVWSAGPNGNEQIGNWGQ